MIKNLKVDELHAHPENPRKDLGDLTELTESIRQNGIYQNLTVVPRDEGGYTVVIGHRRLAAAKAAGLDTVPCAVVEMDHMKQIETMLVENLQRADLTYYEQAQSFQMMLDLGSDVDTISEKTGFSKTTVRRRIKMAGLDQKKMFELSISGRQISLADFDRLFEIEDPEKKNELLDYMGTNNFGYKIEVAINDQKARKNLEIAQADLDARGAVRILSEDAWSNKYESYPGYSSIYLANYGEENQTLPEDDEPIFYRIENGRWLYLYRTKRAKKSPQKSKEEIEKEKKVKAAWAALEEFARASHTCRQAFVKGLRITKENKDRILYGAVMSELGGMYLPMSSDRRDMWTEMLGLPKEMSWTKRNDMLVETLKSIEKKITPLMIYNFLGDSPTVATSGYGKDDFPKFEQHWSRMVLYNWLESLGYEMSEQEKDVLAGRGWDKYFGCEY